MRVMDIRGILHTVAAGAVAFVAMVVFNPFHLTNLTHTFVISISKHAERWRNVHEWHRAFDWTNPVGTAVPFLIMYILGLARPARVGSSFSSARHGSPTAPSARNDEGDGRSTHGPRSIWRC